MVRNVAAYIPGSGPTSGEFVVIGAHYDHLGTGAQGGSLANIARMLQTRPLETNPSTQPLSTIHFGADDNASGTSAMLELARIMSKRPAPARSLVFCAFTAEESGLMGSAYFVKNSPIDLKKTAVMLNLDMVGRIRNNRLLIGGHGTAEPLDAIMKKIDDRSPLQFVDNGKGGLGPSDHMSFAAKKVPVIFFFSGNHPDYHRPTDTADKIDFDGIEQVVAASVPLVDELAKMPMSKYIDAADKFSMRPTAGPAREGVRRASLGVIPKYDGEGDGKGVAISGASEGTAAANAGLKEGDVITKLGTYSIGTLEELSAALAAYKPGDKVKLTYVRDGKAQTVDVTLGERRGG
jgi:Zn-dependent M28 family amino/carboxypeptidase